jgi:hypothetical protein
LSTRSTGRSGGGRHPVVSTAAEHPDSQDHVGCRWMNPGAPGHRCPASTRVRVRTRATKQLCHGGALAC